MHSRKYNPQPFHSRRPQQVGDRQVGFLGKGRLQQWVNIRGQPAELIAWMLSNIPELENFLSSSSIGDNAFEMFMICLKAVLQVSSYDESFTKLLNVLASSQFYGIHLLNYLKYNKNNKVKEETETCLKYIIETSKKVPSKISECLNVIQFITNSYKVLGCDVSLLVNAIEMYNSAGEKKAKKERHLLRKWRDDDEPPDDIREIPIFPTSKDLAKDVAPFLRANKTSGAYRSFGHYFDVMFRLMREDFIQPLREGIAKYTKKGAAATDSDMLFYENVKIIGLDIFNGIEHVLLLDMEKLRTVRWDSDRRLIFGSLVCLSYDNFKTIIYATVTQMDRNELKKGIVRVKFQNCLQDVYGLSSEQGLTMTENPSFFEAYRHVLEGLQEMLETPLPMEKYLVDCVQHIDSPKYLNMTSRYDLSCIIKKANFQGIVQVMRTETWPALSHVCLNQRQYLAVQAALTRELTLVQGPPGTGKTFVGLKIMRSLLENARVRQLKNNPILVVCYTNHALDQFLEEMLAFCKTGIVRVGGKNDSKLLKDFNLKQLRLDQTRSLSERNYIRDCHRDMDTIGKKIKALANKMQILHLAITSEKDLQKFMLPRHFNDFNQRSGHGMKAWLNSSETDFDKHIELVVEAHLVKLFLSEESSLPDTQIFNILKTTVDQKMRVYRFWSEMHEMEYEYFDQDGLINESELIEFIDHKIYQNIRRHFGNIKTWLLGSNVHEMMSAIGEIQNRRRQSQVFDNTDEYLRIRDQRLFNDESDSEEGENHHDRKSQVASSVLQKCRMLGIDITSEVRSEEVKDYAWETVQKKMSIGKVIKQLSTNKPMNESQVRAVGYIWDLSLNDRYRLYKFWVNKYLSSLNTEMKRYVEKYDSVHKQKLEIREMQDVKILQESKVIGMTTTGAAKHRKVLQEVGPRIVVVEEAAEVLEAHIVTALSQHCQHLILIGDHQQLRPKTEVYQLAKTFGLEISLFERLVKNNISCVQLTEQHRMRPEIAKYMKHIYPRLENSRSVLDREHVLGMDKDIFFIEHDKVEGIVQHSKSKLNEYEANYLLKLARYLVYQGYSNKDITILATYGGQVSLIKECLANLGEESLQDIRVSTVDNFQGEQNKIILLSLVRSNKQGSVGFLSTDNRICVALSRAQYGMYVIGNIQLLAQHSALWGKIKATAEAYGEISQVLRLRCQHHQRITLIKNDAEFEFARTGGCGKNCQAVLDCGHTCPYLCHGIGHDKLNCKQQCTKKCKNGHICKSQCYRKCPPCSQTVEVTLPCKHTLKVICEKHSPSMKYECDQECNAICSRGHKCKGKCSQTCPPCQEKLTCGHACNSLQVSPYTQARIVPCRQMCARQCRNGHACPAFCQNECPKSCIQVLPCNHQCGSSFTAANVSRRLSVHRKKIECSHACPKMCPRNRHQCAGKCGEVCPPCQSMVRYKLTCGHNSKLECHKDPQKHQWTCQECNANTTFPCGHSRSSLSITNCPICSLGDRFKNLRM